MYDNNHYFIIFYIYYDKYFIISDDQPAMHLVVFFFFKKHIMINQMYIKISTKPIVIELKSYTWARLIWVVQFNMVFCIYVWNDNILYEFVILCLANNFIILFLKGLVVDLIFFRLYTPTGHVVYDICNTSHLECVNFN